MKNVKENIMRFVFILAACVRQYLRYRNCNNRGSSDWLADLCFSGKILSGKAV